MMTMPSPSSGNGQKQGESEKNQLIGFIGLSRKRFRQKWLKTQIGEGIG